MDQLGHLGWVVQQSYEIGPYLIGIRTNVAAFGDWLEQTLAAYRTSEETDPVYSVLVAEEDDPRPGKPFHILYRESITLAKSLDLSVIARALLAELEGFLFHDRDDAVYAQAGLVAVDGATGLVPSIVVPYLATLGRRLRRAGVSLPLASQIAIDPQSGLAVPIPPLLDADPRAIERLGSIGDGDGRENRIVVDRPTKVDAVCSVGLEGEPVQRVSRGYALFRLAEKVANLEKMGGAALEGLGRLLMDARCYELKTANVAGTRDALLAALSEAASARAPQ